MHMIAILLLFFWPGQDQGKPLPERTQFLAELRKNLRTDNRLLSQYTYTETETLIELDSDGEPKKTEVKVHQVLRSVEPELTYRRLISKNGVPVKPEEIAKKDKEHQKKVEEFERRRSKKTEEELQEIRDKENREEEKIMNEVFAIYEVQFVARERVDGHDAIRMVFKPRSGYKPKTREGKFLQHIAGEAWISEEDHQLVRIDAEVIRPISIGLGLIAKLREGARITAERRKLNDEVWLPARVEFTMNARVFLLKGLNRRQIYEYSDHKKYNVETILTFPDLQ